MGTMIARKAAYLFGTLMCFCAVVNTDAQQPPPLKPPPKEAPKILNQPTEIDLRAAYCRPVIADTIDRYAQSFSGNPSTASSVTANELYAAAVERSRRLELYMLPRIDVVEPTGLLDAQARGKKDVASLAELMRTCDAKCKNAADAQTSASCRQQCSVGSDVVKRTRDCEDISWLPLKN